MDKNTKEDQLRLSLRILFLNYVPTVDEWKTLGVNGTYGQTNARNHALDIVAKVILDQELPEPVKEKQEETVTLEQRPKSSKKTLDKEQ